MNIRHNISLKPYNTFQIDVNAKEFVEIDDFFELEPFFAQEGRPEKFVTIGGGSNILFTKDFDGTIIKLNTKGIDIVYETETEVVINAQAGETWDDFVTYCVENQYYGAENLSLIPGTVGAAPVQNIGAYGVELKDILLSVGVFDTETYEYQVFSKEYCEFGYRWSIFKKTENIGRYIIVYATFGLSKTEKYNTDYAALKNALSAYNTLDLRTVRQTIINIRTTKLPDPSTSPNVGSFFKNPTISLTQFEHLKDSTPNLIGYPQQADNMKLAAGQLIDLCGLKGYTLSNAAVHDRQALVLISNGLATGQDILNLAKHVQARVFEKFCINLEPEVNIL